MAGIAKTREAINKRALALMKEASEEFKEEKILVEVDALEDYEIEEDYPVTEPYQASEPYTVQVWKKTGSSKNWRGKKKNHYGHVPKVRMRTVTRQRVKLVSRKVIKQRPVKKEEEKTVQVKVPKSFQKFYLQAKKEWAERVRMTLGTNIRVF